MQVSSYANNPLHYENYVTTKKMFQEKTNISDEEFDVFYTNYQNDGKEKYREMGYDEDSPELKAVRGFLFDVSKEEVLESNNLRSSYIYRKNTGLDRNTNSISLVPGVTIDLDNGYMLEIKDSFILTTCKNSSYDPHGVNVAAKFSSALNEFIRYANNQSGTYYFDPNDQKNVVTILNNLGIDTTKDFTVNGSTFKYEDGLLRKNGTFFGYTMLTDNVMKKALNRAIDKYTSNFAYI